MRVQIEGMPHYDEQQVVFVLDDPSGFSARIPVILGTPTINGVGDTDYEGIRDTRSPIGVAGSQGRLRVDTRFPASMNKPG